MRKLFVLIALALSLVASTAYALSTTLVTQGGTGVTTFPSSQLIYGNGNAPLSTVATTTVAAGTGISLSANPGALVGGSNLTVTNTGVTSNIAGTGISLSGGTGAVTITNSSPLSALTTTWPLSLSGTALSWIGLATTTQPTAGQMLYSDGVRGLIPVSTSTVTCSSGVSCGSTSFVVGGALSITNSGVTSAIAGTGIGVSGATGAVTITNNGVTSLTAGSGITLSGSTGAITVSNSGATTIGTSTPTSLGISRIWYTTGVTPTAVQDVGTTTITAGTGLTGSFTTINSGGASNSIALSVPVSIANGGSNNSTGFTTNSLVFYDGTRFVSTSTEPLYVGSIIATSTVKASGIGTTSPFAYFSINPTAGVPSATAPAFVIGSSTATSLIVTNNGRLAVGTSSPGVGLGVVDIEAGSATTGLYLTGSQASFLEANVQNRSSSAGASSDLVATADTGTASTNYIDVGINNSGGGSTPFQNALESYLYSSDTGLNIGALGATNPFITVNVGGGSTPIERARFSFNGFGVGTSTPQWTLELASSTKPALAFDSGRAGGDPQFTMRYASTSFYWATTSPTTFATSSNSTLNAPLALVNGGISGLLGIATSSPYAQLSVNAPTGLAALSVGSTTAELFSITSLGTTTALRFDVTGTATSTINAGLFIKSQGLTIGGLTGCTGSNALNTNANGGVVCGPVTATAAAGGSSGQIQYNNATALGGIAVSNYTSQATGNGYLGFGTTTPHWTLNLATSTEPQFTLSDGSITSAPFNMRAINSAFYISTSSPVTFATSSNSTLNAPFALVNGGISGLAGFGTSSPYAALSINAPTGLPAFAVGSSSAELFSITALGTTTAARFDVTGAATSTFASGIFIKGGGLTIPGIVSSVPITNANGNVIAYGGTTCTNQFVRSLSAAAAATCATVGAADVSLANLTALNTSLTFSTTYNGATAATIGLNVGNTNTWSVVQNFNAGAGVPGLTSNALVGIGTTTPKWALTVSSSTGPQLTLTDTSLTVAPVNFRSINGNFYLSTSTPLTFATSSNSTLNAPLSITTGGISGLLGIASSTSWADFGLTSTAGVPAFAVGSTTGTSLLIDKFGYLSIGSSSPWSRFTMDRGFLGISTSSIAVTQYNPATSTTQSVDCRDSNTIFVSLGTGATTITLAPMIGGQSCVVAVMNPNATAGAITWATTNSQKLWWASGGTTPTQTTTANKTDLWSFKAISYPSNATTTPQTIINGAQTPNFGP